METSIKQQSEELEAVKAVYDGDPQVDIQFSQDAAANPCFTIVIKIGPANLEMKMKLSLPPEYLHPDVTKCEPPSVVASASWLSEWQLGLLARQREMQWQENFGSPILLLWIEWLRTESWSCLKTPEKIDIAGSSAVLRSSGASSQSEDQRMVKHLERCKKLGLQSFGRERRDEALELLQDQSCSLRVLAQRLKICEQLGFHKRNRYKVNLQRLVVSWLEDESEPADTLLLVLSTYGRQEQVEAKMNQAVLDEIFKSLDDPHLDPFMLSKHLERCEKLGLPNCERYKALQKKFCFFSLELLNDKFHSWSLYIFAQQLRKCKELGFHTAMHTRKNYLVNLRRLIISWLEDESEPSDTLFIVLVDLYGYQGQLQAEVDEAVMDEIFTSLDDTNLDPVKLSKHLERCEKLGLPNLGGLPGLGRYQALQEKVHKLCQVLGVPDLTELGLLTHKDYKEKLERLVSMLGVPDKHLSPCDISGVVSVTEAVANWLEASSEQADVLLSIRAGQKLGLQKQVEAKIVSCFPKTWSCDHGVQAPVLERVLVQSGVQEEPGARAAFQCLFDFTFKAVATKDRQSQPLPARLFVTSVERIENPKLLLEYTYWRQQVLSMISGKEQGQTLRTAWPPRVHAPITVDWKDRVPKGDAFEFLDAMEPLCSEVNEHFLFHGTRKVNANKIAREGFSLDLAGTNRGNLYGSGIYLAESVSKADEYTDSESGGTIVLCRATLGRPFYTDEDFPDNKRLEELCGLGSTDVTDYHSVCGDREKARGTYREFIGFNSDFAYPEFLVHYQREFSSDSSF